MCESEWHNWVTVVGNKCITRDNTKVKHTLRLSFHSASSLSLLWILLNRRKGIGKSFFHSQLDNGVHSKVQDDVHLGSSFETTTTKSSIWGLESDQEEEWGQILANVTWTEKDALQVLLSRLLNKNLNEHRLIRRCKDSYLSRKAWQRKWQMFHEECQTSFISICHQDFSLFQHSLQISLQCLLVTLESFLEFHVPSLFDYRFFMCFLFDLKKWKKYLWHCITFSKEREHVTQQAFTSIEQDFDRIFS